MLPPDLTNALAALLRSVPLADLRAATSALTARYRELPQAVAAGLVTPLERLAYLAVRMPATYASCTHVFRELRERLSDLTVSSVLDLGAGPGTSVWALSVLGDPGQVTLLERDAAIAMLGRSLLEAVPSRPGARIAWLQEDLASAGSLAPHDLVLVSYVLGELDEAVRPGLVDRAWAAADSAVALIEPGSPDGCARILAARDRLIGHGAAIVAPCPHARACPLAPPDWCHFAVRVPRTRLHRTLKGGALGYEDEKFSYVIAARQPAARVTGRIIDRPEPHKGHVRLRLCTTDGADWTTVTRRDAAAYRRARKARWGEPWDVEPGTPRGPS